MLTLESQRQYQALGVNTTCGGVEVARIEERMEELRRRMTSARSWGIEAELLTPIPFVNAFVCSTDSGSTSGKFDFAQSRLDHSGCCREEQQLRAFNPMAALDGWEHLEARGKQFFLGIAASTDQRLDRKAYSGDNPRSLSDWVHGASDGVAGRSPA